MGRKKLAETRLEFNKRVKILNTEFNRKRTTSDAQVECIRFLRSKGYTYQEIAKTLNVSYNVAYYWCNPEFKKSQNERHKAHGWYEHKTRRSFKDLVDYKKSVEHLITGNTPAE